MAGRMLPVRRAKRQKSGLSSPVQAAPRSDSSLDHEDHISRRLRNRKHSKHSSLGTTPHASSSSSRRSKPTAAARKRKLSRSASSHGGGAMVTGLPNDVVLRALLWLHPLDVFPVLTLVNRKWNEQISSEFFCSLMVRLVFKVPQKSSLRSRWMTLLRHFALRSCRFCGYSKSATKNKKTTVYAVPFHGYHFARMCKKCRELPHFKTVNLGTIRTTLGLTDWDLWGVPRVNYPRYTGGYEALFLETEILKVAADKGIPSYEEFIKMDQQDRRMQTVTRNALMKKAVEEQWEEVRERYEKEFDFPLPSELPAFTPLLGARGDAKSLRRVHSTEEVVQMLRRAQLRGQLQEVLRFPRKLRVEDLRTDTPACGRTSNKRIQTYLGGGAGSNSDDTDFASSDLSSGDDDDDDDFEMDSDDEEEEEDDEEEDDDDEEEEDEEE